MEWGIVIVGLYLFGMVALAVLWVVPDERMARPTEYKTHEESAKTTELKKAA